MTELQMGLIGLGAFAVVGVVVYNKWQEVRQRKQAEQVLKANHPDVLLDEGRDPEIAALHTEAPAEAEDRPVPITDSLLQETSSITGPAGERIEPVLFFDAEPEELPEESVVAPAMATRATVAPNSSQAVESRETATAAGERATQAVPVSEDLHLLAPEIDFIASIDAVEPVPASRIVDAQHEALARVRKPVRWIGYNEETGEWEPVAGQAEREYRHIRAGLQLVNRQGPASENDLAIFSVAMQDLADQLMGIVDLPPRQQALDAAVRLDEFCASVDIQIGINVISQGQVFPGTKLRALAEAAGMTIDAARRFVRRDDDGNVLYVMLNQEAGGFSAELMKTMSTHGLTFLLDVPCVAHGERVFNQMVDLARRFADVLHGALVDDNRRPLSENALEPIRKQIGHYQAQMATQHLPAGNPLTQRLFS